MAMCKQAISPPPPFFEEKQSIQPPHRHYNDFSIANNFSDDYLRSNNTTI